MMEYWIDKSEKAAKQIESTEQEWKNKCASLEKECNDKCASIEQDFSAFKDEHSTCTKTLVSDIKCGDHLL